MDEYTSCDLICRPWIKSQVVITMLTVAGKHSANCYSVLIAHLGSLKCEKMVA